MYIYIIRMFLLRAEFNVHDLIAAHLSSGRTRPPDVFEKLHPVHNVVVKTVWTTTILDRVHKSPKIVRHKSSTIDGSSVKTNEILAILTLRAKTINVHKGSLILHSTV